jgi:hypothetical protein
MARLIEVQDIDVLPPDITLQVGDVLWFAATGGHLHQSEERQPDDAEEVVQLLGIFLQSVIGTNGQILSPMGSPNNVLFLARRPGCVRIDVITGDPWRDPQVVTLKIIVE